MKCDVCGKDEEVIVGCSGYGPVSFAYCEECWVSGREPYGILVTYIASAGHFPEDINEEYQVDIRRQLLLHGISEEQFIKDVEDCIKEFANGY